MLSERVWPRVVDARSGISGAALLFDADDVGGGGFLEGKTMERGDRTWNVMMKKTAGG